MKVLGLTWEFPPFITGGLGMACYGIFRAFLRRGIGVDLIMPARKNVYFSLGRAEDADNLCSKLVDVSGGSFCPGSTEELAQVVGSALSVYCFGKGCRHYSEVIKEISSESPFECLFRMFEHEDYLFRQVNDYTAMAVNIGLNLDFDVIHCHDWLTYPAGMILKRMTGKPMIAHIHATEFDRAGGPGDGRIHDIEYWGMKYCDRVIAVSDYTSRLVKKRYCIEADKIRVVHNAYSVPNSPGKHGRIFKERTVLFMGRITLQKGPDYFLEVARRVLEREKRVRFIMAGSGDMEKAILHQSAFLGLGTKFLVAGFLDRDEVERILCATDIFVLPSVSEPFGIVPLEAMSYGAVAIISKNSGVAEIIEHAYKIDFWDIDRMVSVIVNLIADPDEYVRMSRLGRQEVAGLGWSESADKIVDVFNETGELARC